MVESLKSSITVSRQSPADIGQREVFIAVDDREFAIMRHGESVTREIEPGEHVIRAHNTLIWKKLVVRLQPGEHLRFRAVNRAGWGTYAIASVLGAGPIYLTFEQE
jgi:hypothetical protein